MDFAITALYLLVFNFLLLRFRKLQLHAFKPWVTAAVFNLKFVAGLLIWAVYTFYYKDLQNNDVHKFYNDAILLHDVAHKDTKAFVQLLVGSENEATSAYSATMKNWERNFDEAPINENRTVIRLNALLMFLSFKTYFVHILFMCFFSMTGWVLLCNSVFAKSNSSTHVLSLVVLLLPSVLFWSSGVMKEPVLVLGLGVLVYGLLHKNFWKQVSFLAVGSLLILSVKFYVIACLLPAAMAFLVLKNNHRVPVVIGKYAATLMFVALAAFNVQRVIPAVNPTQMLVNKHTHSVKEAAYFNAGSRIDIPPLTDATSIVEAIPVGVWNVVFRPYLWEGKNIMMLASALENVILVAIVLLCLFSFNTSVIARNEERVTKQSPELNLALFLFISSITYFALIGISTPVLGNIVRYKAPLLPFFLFAFILMVDIKPVTRLSWLQREAT